VGLAGRAYLGRNIIYRQPIQYKCKNKPVQRLLTIKSKLVIESNFTLNALGSDVNDFFGTLDFPVAYVGIENALANA
jgi:hypothetical protein